MVFSRYRTGSEVRPFENWSAPRGPEAAAAWTPRPRIDPETEAYEFDEHRPGWGVPIHQMLLDNGVNIVFHGHDHVYAKEIHRDGIAYQSVAQPSDLGRWTVSEPADRMSAPVA